MLFHGFRPNNPARRRVAAVLALTLALAGCNWFYQSTFPSYVPLIQNQVDVSDRFPYDPSAEFRVEVMNGGTGDYVIIFSVGPSIGERVAIYDENLEEKFFRDGGTAPVGFSFNAPVIIDGAPDLYIGELVFGPGISGPTPLGGINDLGSLKETFYFGSYAGANIAGADAVDFDEYSAVTGGAAFANPSTVGLAGNIERIDVSYDVGLDFFGFATFDTFSGQAVVWTRSLSGWVAPADIAADPNSTVFPTDFNFVQELSVTRDGVVLEVEEDGHQLTFYDLSGNKGDTLDISSRGDTAYAFSAAGTHFYLLLADEGKLIKANTWW